MKHPLKADLLFAEVPYEIRRKVESDFKKDDNWKKVASKMNEMDVTLISNEDLQNLENTQSPSMELIEIFRMRHLQVRAVQICLYSCGLIDIFNHLITNEKATVKRRGDEEVSVMLGDHMEIDVIAFGSPYPQFQWYHNGQVLEGETSNKLIRKFFQHMHVGNYLCQVRQTIDGITEEWKVGYTMSLHETAPVVSPENNLKDVDLKSGESLVLTFKVIAEPIATYAWFKDGSEIRRSFHDTFEISNVGERNAGSYYCIAENRLDFCKSDEVKVTVVTCFAPEKPEIIDKPDEALTLSFGETRNMVFQVRCHHKVAFSCIINGININDLQRYDRPFTQETSENYIHTFLMLYRVHAKDSHRSEDRSINIVFIANSNGNHTLTSVNIKIAENPADCQFTARNKYALLIANQDYGKPLQSPIKDAIKLAEELRSIGFHCMMCSNLPKSEFHDVVEIFSRFLQEGDYVVFYYAGHGFRSNNSDFMIPVQARYKDAGAPQVDSCIAPNEVFNRFQKSQPALIFFVLDCCREVDMKNPEHVQVPDKFPNWNSCMMFSTAESYESYEEEGGSSLLLEALFKHIRENITVQLLLHKCLMSFELDDAVDQKPKYESDLRSARKLTDPSVPNEGDAKTALYEWEKISNLGGTVKEKITVGDIILQLRLRCEHNTGREHKSGPNTISNCIDVIISFDIENSSNLNSVCEKELMFTIELFSSDADFKTQERKKYRITEQLKLPVTDLQAISDVQVGLCFMRNNDVLEEFTYNFGKLSLCNIKETIDNLDNLL